jgi:Tol biopolymer transport system component
MAQPLDEEKIAFAGDPFLVTTQGGQPTLSNNGVLAYVSAYEGASAELVIADRSGKKLLGFSPEDGSTSYSHFEFSPDGKRLVVDRQSPRNPESDLYLIDLTRGSKTRLTFEPGSEYAPVWTPDGQKIVTRAPRELP